VTTHKLKKVGRPALPSNEKKTSYIRVRVTQEKRDKIKALAESQGLTVSDLILLGIKCLEKESTVGWRDDRA
jgi:16S rRNA U516 pseudouridylate synthase RsuA-like enzyme